MWKFCQLLKGGRTQISRSRNANNLVSPSQPSPSVAPSQQDDNNVRQKFRAAARPLAFTPSTFRQNSQRCEHTLASARLLSASDEENGIKRERSKEDSSSGENSENYGRYRRPGRDYDQWHCRCWCRFGDWVSYTTMVAATIHLSRVTVHLLPNDKEKSDVRRLDEMKENGDRISIFSGLKDSVHNIARSQFFYRVAPVLFPDIFNYWCVLPPAREPTAVFSTQQISRSAESSDGRRINSEPLTCGESSSSAASSSSSSATRLTSDDCAVQTDDIAAGTPFDDLVRRCGRQIATLSRLTDVGLEHAIGVDFLKHQLYDEAMDYLVGAARSGHAGALYNLGVCFSRGHGVRRDLSKAVELWRAAADQGHGLSKYQMGVSHARGIGGLATDHDRALRYMEGAAAVGVPEAKTFLAANEYKHGRVEGALELLRDAVAKGDEKAYDLLKEWPINSDQKNCEKPMDGYNSRSYMKMKEKSTATMLRSGGAKPRTHRRRFWASSSSEKEDSLSSSSLGENGKLDDSSSSVVFCDNLRKGNNLKRESDDKHLIGVDINGSSVIETVASLLTLRSLRRSRTAPEFRCHDNVDVAAAPLPVAVAGVNVT